MTSGCRLFADKHFGYGGQKFGGVEKVRVEDEMGFYFRLLGKSADELTAQSGFTANNPNAAGNEKKTRDPANLKKALFLNLVY
jgi:hypothetical protein